jgi:glycosyltransferase involved in cell wall biosynthesis
LLSTPALRGWNRYTINLLEELARQGIDLVLYSHQPLDPMFTNRLRPDRCQVRISPAMPYLWWEQRWLPRQCKADSISVLHSPFNFGLPWASCCPRVLTLHDALFHLEAGTRSIFRRRDLESRLYHWIARSRAHHVITVTEYSKKELVKVLGIPAEKISVTHEAADPAFAVRPAHAAVQAAVRKYGLHRPYFFYIGGWEERKNVSFLVDAFVQASIAGVDLVLAGGSAPELAAMRTSERDAVHLFGWIDDADLAALYAGALAFVYPSRHEGFGLQICEAMNLSCPVLAARASSLPEVLGDGGETFSLNDPNELIGLLRRVAGDSAFRAALAQRAATRSKDLSWRYTAELTISIYERVIAEHRRD